MTEPIWRMLNIAQTEDLALYQQILESAKNRKYPDPEFQQRVCEFLKKHGIIKQIATWLKDEKKRMLKEISKVEAAFDTENPAVAEGFALWKQSMNILTHNKFLEQLKIDYQL